MRRADKHHTWHHRHCRLLLCVVPALCLLKWLKLIPTSDSIRLVSISSSSQQAARPPDDRLAADMVPQELRKALDSKAHIPYSPEVLRAVRGMGVGDRLLFAGLLSYAEEAAQRGLIRETSQALAPPGVTVRFVLCRHSPNSTSADQTLRDEQEAFQDLYLLDCEENMNGGKTVDYWLAVTDDHPGYKFYLKGDSDGYFLWHNIAASLAKAPPCGFYGGDPGGGPAMGHKDVPFRGGPGVILSHDLIQLMRTCTDCPRSGLEDVVTGVWIHHTARHWVQPGDWHEHYLDAGDEGLTELGEGLLGRLDEDLALLHGLKHASAWWAVHNRFIRLVTADRIAGLTRSDFTVFEGGINKFWDPLCKHPKHKKAISNM